MNRLTTCPVSFVIGAAVTADCTTEDIARLGGIALWAVRVAIIGLLIGATLLLAMQWALPLQISPGSGGAHIAVPVGTSASNDADLDLRIEVFLAGISAAPAIAHQPAVIP